MPRFVKKPYVIDAVKFLERDSEHWNPWVQEGRDNNKWRYRFDTAGSNTPNGFEVVTLEGTMKGGPGDYLIRGVEGELYICRGDIFEKTYNKVED